MLQAWALIRACASSTSLGIYYKSAENNKASNLEIGLTGRNELKHNLWSLLLLSLHFVSKFVKVSPLLLHPLPVNGKTFDNVVILRPQFRFPRTPENYTPRTALPGIVNVAVGMAH
jgi:hypothetical protein